MAANVNVLRRLGVPQSSISILMSTYPAVVSKRSDKFSEFVKKVIETGFNHLTPPFVTALYVIGTTSKKLLEHKIEISKRWGLSDDEIMAAFRINPVFMRCSENKFTSLMDFLVNKMCFPATTITRIPSLSIYSLEKRIIARCLVVRALQSKGLIKKDSNILTCVVQTEKRFLEKHVTRYKEEILQLLSVYKGKVELRELGFKMEYISGIPQL